VIVSEAVFVVSATEVAVIVALPPPDAGALYAVAVVVWLVSVPTPLMLHVAPLPLESFVNIAAMFII